MKLGRAAWIAGQVAVLVASTWLRCGPLRPLLRDTDQFVPWPADPRVRYEAGAEDLAARVASALPVALATVEARLYRPFAAPPAIYVCATTTAFADYGANPEAAGLTISARVFLSPKLRDTPERIPAVLAHELAHLHSDQRLGIVRMNALPVWFTEGLATQVSGAGAESVSIDDARRAILAGRALVPDEGGSWLHRRTAHTAGLTPHMFYRQASMFIDWLARDPVAFRSLVVAIERGADLADALRASYATTVADAWQRFARAP